ncbi:titin homolog isoform X2 [Tribolium castaneum]|uniref:titin homolog isoform X2 n=1 Tax=Tribolium castaneum TaxID=7070 RepID=UPI00046C1CD6|nr:PREDICTED: titin homolog isoform X2 [Tribolium castaneum]|eukprot:XP_008192214.1 PREDICTED: titin homolog isoform X2 [Tribolium castaneum]
MQRSISLYNFQSDEYEIESATKKKFWNPKKWFKRKNKPAEDASVEVIVDKDVLRSRSTSELSITEEQTRRRSGSSMHPGLSVSHDSVFHSPNSGSDIELDAAQSSSSLSISQPQIDLRLQTELSERLRLRRGRGDTSEDDEGLPHSPCNSPTTTEALLDKTAIKDLPTKSHSTCSDGSLLSMGSSEMDEESFSQQSRHSSKLSLQEKRSSDQDSDLELGASPSAPLNHSAAHHRVAVRPKRRAPHRNKRVPQLSNALPTTPEVNEEISIRSMTPESVSRETISEHYSMSTRTTLTETQLKCSSLPPGLAPPDADSSKLNRSRSNAGSKSEDHFATLEEDVEREEKTDKSFFDRIFPRRSAKKRKSKEEKTVTVQSSYSKRVESKPIAAPRSGAAARQRIQPIDLPPSPEVQKREPDSGPPEKSVAGTSPLQAELESRFKQRQTLNASLTPPQSPNIDSSSSVITQVEMKTRNEETKTKIKMPGLSSLQQRVLSLNDEVDDAGFKSLTDLPDKPAKPVTKSHSFKAAKPEKTEKFVVTEATNERKISVTKAASLDSVKHLEEPQYTSEVTQEFTVVKNESRIKESDSTFSDFNSDVTVSGPSHTAVVNVNYNLANTITSAEKIKEVTTKECVSVTKIHLKRESTQVTQSTVTVPKNAVPEFLNRQLNKVEAKPSNVVFSMNSPRIIDEQTRPKSVEPDKVAKNIPRKFSQEDIEIIEKSEEAPKVATPRFRKNESNKRKSSTSSTTSSESPPVGEKPILRSRSISLDSLKGETESLDKSSQDSLDKEKTGSVVETVVLRKKSLIKQRNDEEPELMKVFARRSLKLKDSESEAVSQQVSVMLDDSKTRDSDKENQAESPQEERKKSVNESNEAPEIREPLTETIKTPTKEQPKIKEKCIELTEVTLRKPGNNFYTRAFSMNAKSGETDEMKVKKQASFSERRITENWITNIKNGDDLIERKISQDEIITGISPKSDFITEEVLTERKNFNQRKAEWEKRAQEAQKKSVP